VEAAECVVFFGDCSTVRQPRVEEVRVEKVMLIMLSFIKELLVLCIIEFLKGWEVWLTKSTFLVAPQECVDSLLIALVDQS